MNFKDRALPLIKRGICVTPLLPASKKPFLPEWQNNASNNPDQINRWNAENPNYNVGCVATMSFCFLDDDTGDLKETYEAETGNKFPETYTVRTSVKKSGKHGFHYYFKGSAASLDCGNRSKGGAFDFWEDRKQVVGPYSVHPSGIIYTPINPTAKIVDIPDALVAWIEKSANTKATPDATGTGTTTAKPNLEGDLDVEWITRHLDEWGVKYTTYDSDKDYTADVDCPWVGEHSTGKSQHDSTVCIVNGIPGFNCLHGHCSERGWKEFRAQYEHITADDWAWGDFDGEEAKAPIPPTPEAEEEASATAVADMFGSSTEFDERALYGKLGEIAKQSGHPLGWMYPALLTVGSATGSRDNDDNVRGTLYTVLLGGVGAGKSVVMRHAVRAVWLRDEGELATVVRSTPGSDRGLIKLAGDSGMPKIIVSDEFRIVMQKCNIQGSSLAPLMCDLWSADIAGVSTKASGYDECNVKLSILGNVAIDDPSEFSKVFGVSTVAGLADRMVFGVSDKQIEYRPQEIKREIFEPKPVSFPKWVWDAKDEWRFAGSGRRRLSEILLRVALIQSAMNGEREVTRESFEAACRFAEWQLRVRNVYRSGLAETKEAECFESICAALRGKTDEQVKKGTIPEGTDSAFHVNWTKVLNGKSYYRKYGAGLINRTKKAMLEEGILQEVRRDEEVEGKTKNVKTQFVRLRGHVK